MQPIAKQAARYIALGALFLIPLIPVVVFNSFFFPFITGKAYLFRILVEILVCAWIALACIDKEYRPRFSWIGLAVLAFVVWMFIADSFAVNVLKAFWSNYERMEGWVLIVHLLGFFFAASAVLRVEKQWRNWFLASLAVSIIIVIHCFLQLFGALPIHQGSTRIDASFGNSAYLAIYLLFNTFLAGWLALTEKRSWLKWSLIVLAVIEAILIFYTETRGTTLGLIGGLALAAILTALTAGGKARRYALGAFVVIVIFAGGLWSLRDTALVKDSGVLDRITSISLADGQTRFTLWYMAWEGFTASPKTVIVGYGQEGFNYVFNKYYEPSLYAQEPWFDRAHDAFIDWLVAGGLPAFLLYLSLFVTAVIALWKSSTLSRAERIALTAALAGYSIHNLFVFDNLYAYVYFFAILALIDSQVGRPIKYFEKFGTVSSEQANSLVLPLAGVAAVLLIWFVNVPGMADASELIQAITPASDPSQNLAVFQDLLKNPPFSAQEIREQLVDFSENVASDSSIAPATAVQIESYAVSQMAAQVTEHPGDARTLLELALAYRAGGDLPDALKATQAASALSPGKEEIYIEEGATYWDLGDTADAKKAFDIAYALGPQFTDLAAYAAAGDFITGNATEARQILLQNFGTTTVDSDALALAYYHLQDYKDLIALWQLRNSGPSASAQTAYGLAAAYYVAGEKQQAIAAIEAAMSQYPSSASEGQSILAQIEGTSSAPSAQ